MKRECDTCIKRKTTFCPTSMECMATDDMPYYQNRIMLLEENQELKNQLEEHKKIYIYKVNNFLAENVEPDPEDLYMAELEQRAMDCELMEMQQKEFINYLEDEIKTLEKDILETVDDMDIYMKQVKSLIIEGILQKYKETIGVLDENNKQ